MFDAFAEPELPDHDPDVLDGMARLVELRRRESEVPELRPVAFQS